MGFAAVSVDLIVQIEEVNYYILRVCYRAGGRGSGHLVWMFLSPRVECWSTFKAGTVLEEGGSDNINVGRELRFNYRIVIKN